MDEFTKMSGKDLMQELNGSYLAITGACLLENDMAFEMKRYAKIYSEILRRLEKYDEQK